MAGYCPCGISGPLTATIWNRSCEALRLYDPEELEDFFPGALEAYTYKGKLYGIPMSMSVHVMLLNLDHFAEAGVEPPENGRWTWDEFVEKAKALTFDSDGDGVIDKYGFSTYILPGYYELGPLLHGWSSAHREREFGFNTPKPSAPSRSLLI